MLWHTHLAFGVLAGVVTYPMFGGSGIIATVMYFACVMFGSLLPDIDEPQSKVGRHVPILPSIIKNLLGHRGVLHSLWFTLTLGFIISLAVGRSYAVPLVIGYISHILIDGITPMGVNLMAPFANLHIRGFVETGSNGESVVFILIIMATTIKLFL